MTNNPKNKKAGNTKFKDFDFNKAIEELEEINRWFQKPDIDLDEGLEKLRKGKVLISQCEERLVEAENEFTKIRDDSSEELLGNDLLEEDSSIGESEKLSEKKADNRDSNLFADDLLDFEE